MSDLQVVQSNSIVPEGVTFDDTNVTINRMLSYGEWESLVEYLMRMEQSVQWWLGDMLRYGEAAYGEKYAQAAILTGRSVGTLANWVYVSGAFPPDRRRSTVRWSCYRELAPLKDPEAQDSWLDAVEEGGWTREELKRAIRETPTGDSPPRQPSLQPQVSTDPEAAPDDDDDVIDRIDTTEPDRISWTIRISVPESADLMGVQQALERSASALEIVLDQLKADPEVGLAVDVSV